MIVVCKQCGDESKTIYDERMFTYHHLKTGHSYTVVG